MFACPEQQNNRSTSRNKAVKSYLVAVALRVAIGNSTIISVPMTMVDSRNYGGMGYDNMYSHHMQSSPHFSNPWSAHETHSTSAYTPLPKSNITRPSAITMSYSQMPVSAPMSSGSSYSNLEYGASGLLSGHQDISRSGYGPSYSTPSSNSYTATASPYPQLDYSQSLHQQQQQQQHRKVSDSYVSSFLSFFLSFLLSFLASNTC